jgi:hypothetical protein
MTDKVELLHAILAMDSYNREYDAGIQVEGNQVGAATFGDHTALGITEGEYSDWQSAGFYAAAYSVGGEIVVSDRG